MRLVERFVTTGPSRYRSTTFAAKSERVILADRASLFGDERQSIDVGSTANPMSASEDSRAPRDHRDSPGRLRRAWEMTVRLKVYRRHSTAKQFEKRHH